ncbi:spastin-like [Dermacentor andersoni]|uniref:spastin-like n=1 Tax=Dermacentor andersoni TaxID=34620 RepID=UPI003B3A5847
MNGIYTSYKMKVKSSFLLADLKELAIGLYRNGSEQLLKGISIDFSQGQGPTWEWANTLKEKMRANLEIAQDRLDFLETMVMIQHLGEDLPWHAGVARRQAKPKRRRWEKKDRKDADNRGDGPSWLKRAINGVGMTNQLAHIILEEIVDGCPEVLLSDIAGQKEAKQLHTGSEERILVMGATSSSQELDAAALRHFKKWVYVTRLDVNTRMLFPAICAPPKGLLRIGPSGNGKIIVAKALPWPTSATAHASTSVQLRSLLSAYLFVENLVAALQ